MEISHVLNEQRYLQLKDCKSSDCISVKPCCFKNHKSVLLQPVAIRNHISS